MYIPTPQFSAFLDSLSATRSQVDDILARATSSANLSEATMALLWQSIYDVMITTATPEERLKHANLIEKLFSSLTDRRALELRELKLSGTSGTPVDPTSFTDIEQKLKLV